MAVIDNVISASPGDRWRVSMCMFGGGRCRWTILRGRRVGLAHSPVQQRRSYLFGGHCEQTFQNCLVPSRHKSGPAVALCPPNPTHTDSPRAQPGGWEGGVGEGGRPGCLPAGPGGDLLPGAGVEERVPPPVCREP